MPASAYITGLGSYLPGEPVDNDAIADRLGGVGPGGDRIKNRILDSNGIRQRHYALDADGETTELNEELAVKALQAALADRGIGAADLGMLACATTQGDLLIPGFGSMVHGRLGGGPMQVLTAAGVCASSLAALDAASAKIRLGDHPRAAVVGSELASRWLHRRRFASGKPSLDAEFLRWMLSDGAGAVVLEFQPHPDRPSLRLDWVRQMSLAHEHKVCMRAGMSGTDPVAGQTWQDQADVASAEQAGLMHIRQDTRDLAALAEAGLQQFEELVDIGLIDLRHLDHVLCHYSTNAFRDIAFDGIRARIPGLNTDRWFSNLETRGNTGSASIFIALEEAWRTGRFAAGDTVLLAVPESGRFSFAFAHLTVVEPRPGNSSRGVSTHASTAPNRRSNRP
ncbi:3-oxoacyl-[acyl-carrier-protein] synthase III C-terminal domain-containing protein [Microlunatus sp. Y2014]|uniref:3-oxoacyl-[acyl-carrier-protein] synthase III C-terminal domain-containing protein n=1 Tax=Microlunatus sp. Y2014 TaxID=3418488 RepID=UPI003DA76582